MAKVFGKLFVTSLSTWCLLLISCFFVKNVRAAEFWCWSRSAALLLDGSFSKAKNVACHRVRIFSAIAVVYSVIELFKFFKCEFLRLSSKSWDTGFMRFCHRLLVTSHAFVVFVDSHAKWKWYFVFSTIWRLCFVLRQFCERDNFLLAALLDEAREVLSHFPR